MANRIEVVGSRTYEFEVDDFGRPLRWRVVGGAWQSAILDGLPSLDASLQPSDKGWKPAEMCARHGCYAFAGRASYCAQHSVRQHET